MLGNICLANAQYKHHKIPGLAAWWDFSDVSTITKDVSDNVSAVADKTGNGHTISQGTASNQPLWLSNYYNGLDVLFFDSTTIEHALTGSSFFNTDLHDIFVVAKGPFVGTFRDLVGTGATTTGSGNLLLMSSTNSFTIRAHYWGSGTTVVDSVATDTLAWALYNQGLDANTLYLRLNGAADNSTALVGTKSGGTTPVWVGWRGTSSAYFHGWMGEVLVFDTYLSATNRAIVESELKAKWGIA